MVIFAIGYGALFFGIGLSRLDLIITGSVLLGIVGLYFAVSAFFRCSFFEQTPVEEPVAQECAVDVSFSV